MNEPGTLYVVATPIGNLDDITIRALQTLSEVDLIAAEDTRRSRRLLSKFSIATKTVPYHAHNEQRAARSLLRQLLCGSDIALICDAGTPLISDPGRNLVSQAHASGIAVEPVPGPSALTSAISVSGLSGSSMMFAGFLPARRSERIGRLKQLALTGSTLVFFEAPHRIIKSLEDAQSVFGESAVGCVAREMTKIHESIYTGTLSSIVKQIRDADNGQKGEFVIIVGSSSESRRRDEVQADELLMHLLDELTPSKAAAVAARILGRSRNALYRQAVDLHRQREI